MKNCIVKNIVQILTVNRAYCNFCLKDIQEENCFSFEDEVILNHGISNKLSDLSSFILGFKISSISATNVLCRKCVDMIIITYKFIQMCRNNTQQLENAVASLESSVNEIVNVKNKKNTLYIGVHIPTYLFDSEYAPDTCYALKRLEKIQNAGFKSPKSEVWVSDQEYVVESSHIYAAAINLKSKGKKSKKIKQKSKINRPQKIPLNEIMFDMNNVSQYKCKICYKTYSNLYRLKQHFLRVHSPKDFTCTMCSRSYGSAALLAQHKYDSHSPLMCSDCGKSYTCRSSFKTHVESHKLKLVCQLCGKVFKNKRSFSKHMLLNICDRERRKANLEKKYECDYCSKRYSCKSTLRSHIQSEHGNGEAHVCSWCNKKFNAISRLNAHIVTHTQEKKFSCDVCSGRFVTKESLVYHTRIHTGEKPYQCEHCEKRFLSTSRRAEHVRRYHSDPMIECDLCQSKFRSRFCLTRHKKRHFNPNSRLHYSRIVSETKEV